MTKDTKLLSLEEIIPSFKLNNASEVITTNDFRERLELAFYSIFHIEPKIETITWAQYKPLFKDGDACYFEVYEINFLGFVPSIFEEFYEDYDDELVLDSETLLETEEFSKQLVNTLTSLSHIMKNSADFMKEIYGEDIFVVATKKRIYTQPCLHD